ncbi:hypothetical protein RJ640_013504 [Escallonia rubra]|uniref:Peptidase S9A N-terminal domain-containing protein n=1 Tax=Escallonia rubra TaxID=112253 RepID=A0AA88URC0_9ASTE|nr:hypothetical protein RJ640_013504 [Escallonia rubra]
MKVRARGIPRQLELVAHQSWSIGGVVRLSPAFTQKPNPTTSTSTSTSTSRQHSSSSSYSTAALPSPSNRNCSSRSHSLPLRSPHSSPPMTSAGATPSMLPPVAKKVRHEMKMFGDVRIDDYYWLRDDSRSDPEG